MLIVTISLPIAYTMPCLPLRSCSFDTIASESAVAVQAGLLEYVKREYQDGQAEGQLFCQFHPFLHSRRLILARPG